MVLAFFSAPSADFVAEFGVYVQLTHMGSSVKRHCASCRPDMHFLDQTQSKMCLYAMTWATQCISVERRRKKTCLRYVECTHSRDLKITAAHLCMCVFTVSVCESTKPLSPQGPLEMEQSQQKITVAMKHSLSTDRSQAGNMHPKHSRVLGWWVTDQTQPGPAHTGQVQDRF